MVFDKTGTLTQGRFGITDVMVLDDRSENDPLKLAASLDSQSEHPIAQGIVDGARARGRDMTQWAPMMNLDVLSDSLCGRTAWAK